MIFFLSLIFFGLALQGNYHICIAHANFAFFDIFYFSNHFIYLS